MRYPIVIPPRRFKADAVDGVIATILMLVPLFALTGIGDRLPSWLQALSLIGIPAAVLYIVLRDALGKGTSPGKRALGVRIIDVRTGTPCSARRVWARDLLDPIPILDFIDFVPTRIIREAAQRGAGPVTGPRSRCSHLRHGHPRAGLTPNACSHAWS